MTSKKRTGPWIRIGSREHGQKRGGGPQGTAPASPQQPEGRRYYATGGLRRRLEPGVSREGQLSIPSIRYQLTAWASIGGGSEGKEERAFMPGSYRTGEQYTPEGGLHGERGKLFPSCTPVQKGSGASPCHAWWLYGGFSAPASPRWDPDGRGRARGAPVPFQPSAGGFSPSTGASPARTFAPANPLALFPEFILVGFLSPTPAV